MATILILVGTESGNAQMVADALQPVLKTAGHSVAVSDKAMAKARGWFKRMFDSRSVGTAAERAVSRQLRWSPGRTRAIAT